VESDEAGAPVGGLEAFGVEEVEAQFAAGDLLVNEAARRLELR